VPGCRFGAGLPAFARGIGLILGVDRLPDVPHCTERHRRLATAVAVARSSEGARAAAAYPQDARSGIVAKTASATASSLS
jgi:hypothetical protein